MHEYWFGCLARDTHGPDHDPRQQSRENIFPRETKDDERHLALYSRIENRTRNIVAEHQQFLNDDPAPLQTCPQRPDGGLAIRLLLGDRNPERPRVRARLRGSLSQVKGLTFFPRGRISAEGSQLVFAPGAQQSSMQIASWSGANAVAVIPPGEGRIDAGAEIEVLLTGNIA